MNDYLAVNLANWNSRVPHHVVGYELATYRDDPRHLSRVVTFDLPRLGDIRGLGVGRFAKIGIPMPGVMAPFVGVVEIACGALVIGGLLTRLAAVPLLIDILVAIATTKVPMLFKSGFWATAHESRTDVAMLLGLLFLIAHGSGPRSFDARWFGARRDR